MTPELRRAVWVLGATQCIYWGVLYYGFSVLLVPIQAGLQLSRTVVAGAFSFGLFAMALGAHKIGRWIDRNHGARAMQFGAYLAAFGLVIVSQVHTAVGLYLAWLVLGLAMAALLYETAFGLVIRAVEDSSDRLRALAAVTVLAGLASTIFLPAMSLSVSWLGWRESQLLFAVVIVVATWSLRAYALPALHIPPSRHVLRQQRDASVPIVAASPKRFFAIAGMFVVGTLASMSLTTLLIPLLLERGHSPGVAAIVLGTLGVMQLPGRIWILRGGRATSLHMLVILPLALQAAGLLTVAVTSIAPLAAVGVAMFGVGAGLHTLARPWLIQRFYGTATAGYWNARVASLQGYARAIGPVAAAALSMKGGEPIVFGGLGLALAAIIPMALSFLSLQPEEEVHSERRTES